nr:GNAT family N-acetyltransferase [Maliibacterium massiliense]
MLIRTATPQDVQHVYALICALEAQDFDDDAFARVYRQNLAQQRIHYYLALDGRGAPLGFISLHEEYLLHHCGRVAEIQELVVAAHARGQGVGRALWAHARAQAVLHGCTHLEVCCNVRRTGARAFYERQGMACDHHNLCMPL